MARRSSINLGLCEYHTNGFTQHEIDAIKEYEANLTLRSYFDLEELLEEHPDLDVDSALRHRVGELTVWHTELNKLMADPRLENARRRTTACPNGPPPDKDGIGAYAAAVVSYLRFAAEGYHRHCRGVEHTITVRTLGLQPPDVYPLTIEVDFVDRSLRGLV